MIVQESGVRDPKAGTARDGAEGRDGPAGHAGGAGAPELRRPHTLTVLAGVVLLVAALTGLFLIGWAPHRQAEQAALRDAERHAAEVPTVAVVAPRVATAARELVFPCDVRPNQEAAITPRANGYLKKLYVDIGSQVKEGQVLAEIDTPEVDAQLAESKAALVQAEAAVDKARVDLELAQRTYDRYEDAMRGHTDVVAPQEVDVIKTGRDQAASALRQAEATVKAGQATVDRLTVLQGFEKVTAPFSGTITARNYDVGALLSPSGTGTGRELFRLTDSDTLRVFVNVPQVEASDIRQDSPVTLNVRNFPGRDFTGSVALISDAIDAATRTMLVELRFPNTDHALYAGMYGTARVPTFDGHPALVIPTSALVFNAGGSQVALVVGGKVHFQKIVVGRDLGTELEIVDGLKAGDAVVSSPNEQLTEGGAVQLAGPGAAVAQGSQQPLPGDSTAAK